MSSGAEALTTLGVSPLDVGKLGEKTPPDRVKKRQGNKQHGGECQKEYGVCQLPHRMLDYVTARYVMERLDELGAENWQSAHLIDGGKVAAGIGIRIDGEWVWKWNGAGETDIEGEKGAFSDAFKRAGVLWGIARDLYGEDSSDVQSQPQRQTQPQPQPQRQPVNQPPAQVSSSSDLGACPTHRKPWRSGNYGYYCPTKAGPGEKANKKGYCDEHPDPMWAAQMETAA